VTLQPEYLAHLPIQRLPEGIEHLEGSRRAVEIELLRGVESGQFVPMTRLYPLPGDRAFVRVRRLRAARGVYRTARPRWQRPAALAAGGIMVVLGVGAAVSYVVEQFTSAVRQAGDVLGGFVGLSILLLLVAAVRRRRPREFSGTFRGTLR
jgi:hypothetical protein